MKRPLSFAVIAFATAFTILSAAQQKKPARKPVPPGKAAPAPDEADAAPLASREEKAPAKGSGVDAGVVEQKTLDGGARVFRFGEVEVEGRLKSPQIVYFLRRVRAEFAAGDLGHRTFMRELSETRNEPVF